MLLFFFNDTPTTEIYTLSLHDALPIAERGGDLHLAPQKVHVRRDGDDLQVDRGDERGRHPVTFSARRDIQVTLKQWDADGDLPRRSFREVECDARLVCLHLTRGVIMV